MDAGLGGWAANDADGLARALAGTSVGLGALSANRQSLNMANTSVTLYVF